MSKLSISALLIAGSVLSLSSCATDPGSALGATSTQAVERQISSWRSKLGNPDTDSATLAQLADLAAMAEAESLNAQSPSSVRFTWTTLAAYAYEGMTLSLTGDAAGSDDVFSNALISADTASDTCLERSATIDGEQGNLCAAAFTAQSLVSTRKMARDFGPAMDAALSNDTASDATADERWDLIKSLSDQFGEQVDTMWARFSPNLASIAGTEEEKEKATANFRKAALTTACDIDSKQAGTSFSTAFAPVGSPYYQAKVSYWSAMTKAADFLEIEHPEICRSTPDDGVGCQREWAQDMSRACISAADTGS